MTNKNHSKTTILFVFLALFVLPVVTYAQNVGELDFIPPEVPGFTDYIQTPGYTDYVPSPGYTDYAVNPVYASTPYYDYGGYGYGGSGYFSANLGFGYNSYPYYYPSSVFSPFPVFVSTPVPTTTFIPTPVFAAPTPSITYAPTTIATDSHDYIGPTTVTTDSHNYTNISVVSQAAPQYPTQYVYGGGSYFNAPTYYSTPNYFPTYAPPSCSITAGPGSYGFNYGNNGTVLSWYSNNANSGYISPLVGTVAPAGSTVVYPNQNTLYTLTVSGNGGTSSCQTYTGAVNYAAPAPVYTPPVVTQTAAPYVALTQIPYTGFDFGPFGNAMYWTLLALFAVSVSYLALYFLPSLKLWQAGRGGIKSTVPAKPVASVTFQETKPVIKETAYRGTKDSMISVSKEGLAPRIVVLRA